MTKIVALKLWKRCLSGSKTFACFFILLLLVLSINCAGPGYFAGKDVTLEHFTERESTTIPYKIVQDKKNFYIVRDNQGRNGADKPQVSKYPLYKGTFMGVASDNQANMIARLVAESHNTLDADLRNAADGITGSIQALSSSTENKFLTIESRISALENKLKELSYSISASADTTRKEIASVSADTHKAITEFLSLKTETDGIPSEIVIFFPKGKHTLSNFEEERFVQFLDSLTRLARKTKLYFAILSKESSLSKKRTSSLASIIDRYLAEFPHELNISADHDERRDKDAILVGASFDPAQLPNPKEMNATEETKPIPKEGTSVHKLPNIPVNTIGHTGESTFSIPVKKDQGTARAGQQGSKTTLKSIPATSAQASPGKIPDKPGVIKPAKPSEEQIKRQGTNPKKDKNDEENDPNIEELRQILMDSGKMKR